MRLEVTMLPWQPGLVGRLDMRIRDLFLAAGLLAGVAAAPALAQHTALTDSGTSSIEVGRGGDIFTFHTVNTSYQWLGFYRPELDGYQHLVLKKTVEGTVSNGAEGTLGAKVRLEVSEVTPSGLTQLYVIEDD